MVAGFLRLVECHTMALYRNKPLLLRAERWTGLNVRSVRELIGDALVRRDGQYVVVRSGMAPYPLEVGEWVTVVDETGQIFMASDRAFRLLHEPVEPHTIDGSPLESGQ